ncbi:D-Tyr tRNAtyr deacylase-like domain-containing protein [Cytidiella melzeri]|nr:D-Tyr tRNAtyr deacylase-like domain-containing protein [Cytidiella melzeri]
MRAVVQQVASASVTVDNELISSIGRGLMVLVGIGTGNCVNHSDNSSSHSLALKVFSDEKGAMWKQSVKDIEGEILCVSQFTLFANTSKGNKPDFHRAMATEPSRQMYSVFLERMHSLYKAEKIKDGRFGAMMNVSLINDGPVTFTLDSRKFEYLDMSRGVVGTSMPTSRTRKTAAESKSRASRSDEPANVSLGELEEKSKVVIE